MNLKLQFYKFTLTRSTRHAFAPMQSPVDIPPQPEYISSNASVGSEIFLLDVSFAVLLVPHLCVSAFLVSAKGLGTKENP